MGDVAQKWGLVAEMYERSTTGEIEEVVRLTQIDGRVAFDKIVEWTTRYKDKAYSMSDEDRYNRERRRLHIYEPEDKRWLPKDEQSIFKIMHTAYILQCHDLYDLTCEVTADKLKELSVEQIREKFKIECDYTPEQLAEMQQKNQWIHCNKKPIR